RRGLWKPTRGRPLSPATRVIRVGVEARGVDDPLMGKLGRFLTTVVAAGTVLGVAALALLPIGGVLGGASHTMALSQPVRLKPLVKNAVLDSQRSINRKLHEAVLAFRLEQQMTKDQILERYLNTVYLGEGAYGIEAAAQTYFGTDVSRLSTAQAALLAGEIRNPEGDDPIHQPAGAAQRRSQVLDSMVANGHLSADEAAQLKTTPLPTTLHPPAPQQ